MRRWRSGGISAYSEPASLVLRSRTVTERGMVMSYLASADDLMWKVIGVSSADDSSAILMALSLVVPLELSTLNNE